jgi:hypothetical protein
MNDNERRRDEDALTAILAEIAAGKIKLYRNVLRQPYVFCDHPAYPGLHLHLHAKDFRGWLTHFIWKTKTFLLGEREIDRILEELAGRSLSEPLDKIHNPALLQCIEGEPVVAVVLEFMHTRDRYEASMEGLWKELEKFARGRRLLVRGKKCFPGGSNVLSRKLAEFTPVFKELAIAIEIRRSNGCKVTLARRLDDSEKEPSAESSVSKSNNGQSLSPKDDKAERIARLQQRKERITNDQSDP